MRSVLSMLTLLALIAAIPAFAQSDALKEAWQRTDELNSAGKYADAESWAKKAVDLAKAEFGTNSVGYASSVEQIAALYLDQGRYDEAEPLLKRALATFEKVLGIDDPYVATSLNDIAVLYDYEGRYDEAEQLYNRSLEIREKFDHSKVAESLNNLAALYWHQGRYGEAEKIGKQTLAIREKALGPNDLDVAETLNILANLYLDQGRYDEAEPRYKRALAIREKTLGPDHPAVSITLNNLALLYFNQHHYSEGMPLEKRALAIREKTLGPDHPAVATSLAILAALYYEQSHVEAEQGTFLGDIYSAISSFRAFLYIHRAAEITAHRSVDAIDGGKGGQAELRNRREIFLQDVTISMHLASGGGPGSRMVREDAFSALQWSKTSNTATAVAHMAARFSLGGDDLAKLILARQETQRQLDDADAAFLKIASRLPDKTDPKSGVAFGADEDDLRRRLEHLDDELATKFPRYAELANPDTLSIEETQKLLAPDQALIVFAIGSAESYVAVVSHDKFELRIFAIGSAVLSAEIKALRKTLKPDGNTGEVPPFDAITAYKLYQQLLAPAQPILKDATHLYVVTDGALESLPLGVLLTDEPSADALSAPDKLRAAPWLTKSFAISVLPSVSSLAALRNMAQAPHAPQPYIGIGNPSLKGSGSKCDRGARLPVMAPSAGIGTVFRGGQVDRTLLNALCPLPETAGELYAEAKLFDAAPDSVLLGPYATVTAVKHADLASHRVVAFATHGLLAGDVGIAEPGLVLTPPAQPSADDDGLLKASEIAELKLNADLVILSACNTAASDGTPGAEGFSGLAKAFLYAGARSLIVSHWPVESDATVALMTRMAAHLKEKDVGRADALRRAELDLMRDKEDPDLAHPIYWAPFVVVGEGF